jgi:hypothetical protein
MKAYRIPAPHPQDGNLARKRSQRWGEFQKAQEKLHQSLADALVVKPAGPLTSALRARRQKGGS